MMVPRILVPVDAKAPARESAVEARPYRRAQEATAVPRGLQKGVAAPRPMLFAQSMLENSPTKPQGPHERLGRFSNGARYFAGGTFSCSALLH